MNVLISQPMYFPWRGIFEQVKLCDVFVFYDDVQLPKGGGKGRGFITRIQIKTPKGWQWLSVPVTRSQSGHQLISETSFRDQKWRQSHLSSIHNAYAKAPFYKEIRHELLEPLLEFETDSLSEFCIHAIKLVCAKLDLHPEFHLSSQLPVLPGDDANQRVLDICKHFDGTSYISGHGGMRYLDHERFDRDGIKIKYMKYDNVPYEQINGEFNPYVSILDVLFNVGPDAPRYLTSNAIDWNEWDLPR